MHRPHHSTSLAAESSSSDVEEGPGLWRNKKREMSTEIGTREGSVRALNKSFALISDKREGKMSKKKKSPLSIMESGNEQTKELNAVNPLQRFVRPCCTPSIP